MASAAWGQAEAERVERERVEGKLWELGWVVERVVRRWWDGVDSHSLEDLRQEARLGVWKAILTYDPGKGVKLSTYAYRCATYRVLDAIRACRRDCELVEALEAAVAEAGTLDVEGADGEENGGEWTLDRFLACLGRDNLRAAYQHLDLRKQAIIAWSFGGRETNAQIADRLQQGTEAAKKTRQRAVRQMSDEVMGLESRCGRRVTEPAHGLANTGA